MNDYCIILTGLPASGKTTIGREVAKRLAVPFLDKDDYLEQLYDERGIGGRAWRTQLSLESNRLFQADAILHEQAVLVSHWRPTGSPGPSGTPTDWLLNSYQTVIELYCECSVELAVERFQARERHSGHLDGDRELDQVAEWMAGYQAQLPLKIGRTIRVNSTADINFDQLVSKLNRLSLNA